MPPAAGPQERPAEPTSGSHVVRDAVALKVEIDLTEGGSSGGFTIDLVRLAQVHEPDADALGRYAALVQVQRQDFNGRFLTVRRDDLRVLAAILGRTAEDLGARLEELGLRARV